MQCVDVFRGVEGHSSVTLRAPHPWHTKVVVPNTSDICQSRPQTLQSPSATDEARGLLPKPTNPPSAAQCALGDKSDNLMVLIVQVLQSTSAGGDLTLPRLNCHDLSLEIKQTASVRCDR